MTAGLPASFPDFDSGRQLKHHPASPDARGRSHTASGSGLEATWFEHTPRNQVLVRIGLPVVEGALFSEALKVRDVVRLLLVVRCRQPLHRGGVAENEIVESLEIIFGCGNGAVGKNQATAGSQPDAADSGPMTS